MQLNIFVAVFAAIFFIFAKTHAAPLEILDERATPAYWLARTQNGDKILFTPAQIKKFNDFVRERDPFSANLNKFPSKLDATAIADKIRTLAAPTDNCNLDGLNGKIPVRYAVSVERANVRNLPSPHDGDRYDSLQGTALDPAEAVAVLWDSADAKFVFAQTRNYFGWIEKNSLAFTSRAVWLSYANPKNFLAVTANKIALDLDGRALIFQMGAKIPLVNTARQNDCWSARLPVSHNGALREVKFPIPADEAVNLGWLDCTTNNFIRQSFKFLGDVYGWGGLGNSVDCSAFVNDVYRSMGLEIPRDADKQEGAMPIVAVFNDVTHADRLDIVSRAPTGALLFKPGHVLLNLGTDDAGTPIVIHAASSYFSDGYKIFIRKVLVSDLSYENGAGIATIDGLTGIAFAK